MRNLIPCTGRALLALCTLLALLGPAGAGPDAARALSVGCGGQAMSPVDEALCDVEPGRGIDILDAVRLARRSTGLDPWSLDHVYSFEDGLQGWIPRGTDLDDPPVVWSITASQDRATYGKASAKLYLVNENDAGKIWLERPFRLKPNTAYAIRVQYDFATSAFGDFNLWRIITGVHPGPPQTRDDLTFQGETGNGSPTNVGYVWLEKSYDFQATTGEDGLLYVCVGIWGTWESPGTYYVDDVRIVFAEKT